MTCAKIWLALPFAFSVTFLAAPAISVRTAFVRRSAVALLMGAAMACALAPRDLHAASPAALHATGDVVIQDRFGRSLNDGVIPLLNWDGYMANPALELTVAPPENAAYPAQVTLWADDARLYFDRPSHAGPNGPTKALWFA